MPFKSHALLVYRDGFMYTIDFQGKLTTKSVVDIVITGADPKPLTVEEQMVCAWDWSVRQEAAVLLIVAMAVWWCVTSCFCYCCWAVSRCGLSQHMPVQLMHCSGGKICACARAPDNGADICARHFVHNRVAFSGMTRSLGATHVVRRLLDCVWHTISLAPSLVLRF